MTCRVVAPFVDALIESAADMRPPPASYAAIQTIVASATIYAGRHGPKGIAGSNIFSCLSNTVFCRVCFKVTIRGRGVHTAMQRNGSVMSIMKTANNRPLTPLN